MEDSKPKENIIISAFAQTTEEEADQTLMEAAEFNMSKNKKKHQFAAISSKK